MPPKSDQAESSTTADPTIIRTSKTYTDQLVQKDKASEEVHTSSHASTPATEPAKPIANPPQESPKSSSSEAAEKNQVPKDAPKKESVATPSDSDVGCE